LGRRDLNEVEVTPLEANAGDIFLLCSDGLTEEVEDETIFEILRSEKSYDEKAMALIESAKEAGGSDNITVVLVGQD
jgi:protein phosphatase